MRLSVEEVPATPAMASMLMVIHLMQRSVLRRPDTETCAVRSAHASREVLDRSLSCGRSVDAIGAPQRLRCQLPHIGASGAPAASNEACWCATATPTGQSKPTVRETPWLELRRLPRLQSHFPPPLSDFRAGRLINFHRLYDGSKRSY